MSAALLIAAMAGRPLHTFVGFSNGGEASVSGNLHANAQAGDYVAILYFNGRTITPPAGAPAYGLEAFGNSKVSHRRLTEDDIGANFTFDGATPYVAAVVRGAEEMSESLASLDGTGTLDAGIYKFAVPGITPTALAGMVLVAAMSEEPALVLTAKGSPFIADSAFDEVRNQGTTGFCYGLGLVTNLEDYVPGTALKGYTSPAQALVRARVFELR